MVVPLSCVVCFFLSAVGMFRELYTIRDIIRMFWLRYCRCCVMLRFVLLVGPDADADEHCIIAWVGGFMNMCE